MTLKSFTQSGALSLICFLFVNVVAAQKQDIPFQCRLAEEMPEYPGGAAALMKYLLTNLRYPENNHNEELCGRVIVRFVINKSGKTEQIKIAKGCNNVALEAAIIKLIRDMPAWVPGKCNGTVVDCDYTLPISIHWSE